MADFGFGPLSGQYSTQGNFPYFTGSPFGPPQSGYREPDIMSLFMKVKEQALQQHQKSLRDFAAPLRELVFQASPELARASKFLQERFEQPIPEEMLNTYRQNLRQAQISRGFEGGQGPALQEAELLTGLVEQERSRLLPAMQQFGGQILGMTGLMAPPEVDFPSFASSITEQGRTGLAYSQLAQQGYQHQQEFGLAQRRFEEELRAGLRQSQWAQRQYSDTMDQIRSFQRGNFDYGAVANRPSLGRF